MAKYNKCYSNNSYWSKFVIFIAIIAIVCFVLNACGTIKSNTSTESTTFLVATTREGVYFDPQEGICYILFSERQTSGYYGYGYGLPYTCGDNDKPYHYNPKTQIFFTLPDPEPITVENNNDNNSVEGECK